MPKQIYINSDRIPELEASLERASQRGSWKPFTGGRTFYVKVLKSGELKWHTTGKHALFSPVTKFFLALFGYTSDKTKVITALKDLLEPLTVDGHCMLRGIGAKVAQFTLGRLHSGANPVPSSTCPALSSPPNPEAPPQPASSPATHTSVATPSPSFLNWLARKCILPSCDISQSERAELRETYDKDWSAQDLPADSPLYSLSGGSVNFHRTHISIQTSDGIPLHAIRYQPILRQIEAPPKSVIIYCNPNAGISDTIPCGNLLLHMPMYDCDVINFDYRSTGGSGGEFTATQDLVNDAVSVANWAHHTLGVDPSQVHFVGHSLGGTVAVKAKAALGKTWTGDVVADRSFSSLNKVAEKFVKYSSKLLPDHLNLEVTKDDLTNIGGKVTILYLPGGYDHMIRIGAGMESLVDPSSPADVCAYPLIPDKRIVKKNRDHHSFSHRYLFIKGQSASSWILANRLTLPTFKAHIVAEPAVSAE